MFHTPGGGRVSYHNPAALKFRLWYETRQSEASTSRGMKRSHSSRQRPRAVCFIPPGSKLFHTEQGGVFRTLRKCLGWWHLSPHVSHVFLVGCIVNVSYPWLWAFHTHFSRFIPGLASGVLLGPPSHVPVQDDRVLFTVACLLHCE